MASKDTDPGRRLLKRAIHDAVNSKFSVTSSIKREMDKAKREKWKRKSESNKLNSIKNLVTHEMAEVYKKIEDEAEMEKRNLVNKTSNSKVPLGRGRGKPSQNSINVYGKNKSQSLPFLGHHLTAIIENDVSSASDVGFNSFNWPVQTPKSHFQSEVTSKSLTTHKNVVESTNNSKDANCGTFTKPNHNVLNMFDEQNKPFSITHREEIKCLEQSRSHLSTSLNTANQKKVSFKESEKSDAEKFRLTSTSEITHPFIHEIRPAHYTPLNNLPSGLFYSEKNQSYYPPIAPSENLNNMIQSADIQNYSSAGMYHQLETSTNINNFLHFQPDHNTIFTNSSIQKSSPIHSEYQHSIENTSPKVPLNVVSSNHSKSSHKLKNKLSINRVDNTEYINNLIDSMINKKSTSSDVKSNQSNVMNTNIVANKKSDSIVSGLTDSVMNLTIDLNPNSRVLSTYTKSDKGEENNNNKSPNMKISITNSDQISNSVNISVTTCREINPVHLSEVIRISNLIEQLK